MPTKTLIEDLKAKTRLIVKRAGKGSATAVFVASSLVPFGLMGANEAQAIVIRATHMEAEVVFNNATQKWDYTFEVFNDSTFDGFNDNEEAGDPIPLGVNWELPVFDATNFDDDVISSVMLPEGWDVELLERDNDYESDATLAYGGYDWDSGYDHTTDPFHGVEYDGSLYETPEYVIHFFSTIEESEGTPDNPILPFGDSLEFGFSSDYTGTNAPYLMSYFLQAPESGDPPTPGGPPTGMFGILSPNAPRPQRDNAVPEPVTSGMAALASMALFSYTRRRR